jgi:DNA-binding NarL/FixJ family response regulator
MSKVLLAEDHPLFRDALRNLLQHVFTPEVICFEAADRNQLIDVVAHEDDLDLIVLDLFMPGTSGLPEILALRDKAPATPVVVVSSLDDSAFARQAITCGASGYIPKSASRDVMLSAFKTILAGGLYLPGQATGDRQLCKGQPHHHGIDQLTPRQLDVLNLLAAGKSNKEIARELAISDLTVKVHMTTVLRKLGVSTRTQALVAFRQSETYSMGQPNNRSTTFQEHL